MFIKDFFIGKRISQTLSMWYDHYMFIKDFFIGKRISQTLSKVV